MQKYVLAIDQGTTSTRAILFTDELKVASIAQQEFAQQFPRSGWVEHDPEDLWTTTVATCRKAIAQLSADPSQIAAIGITNQRETTLVWDRSTGTALHNAIVWQDRRTADICARLRDAGHEPMIMQKTGLLLDPYFSATKVAWILENVDGARAAADQGRLAFGTVDSFLLWRLTGGKAHGTDATNASRTMLYDIVKDDWSDELLALFDIPRSMLPDVKDCACSFGTTDPQLFGAAIPIAGIAGDQQAATVGQACFKPGMMKSTYGTGCFALLNIGDTPAISKNRLITTIAYQLNGQTTYALEGSIFIAGAAVQCLRDGLGIIDDAAQTGAMADAADPNQDVYLVPAFTGMGAPYWDAEARGAMFGLTRNTGPKELARAALEAACFQTLDLVEAMRRDWDGASNTVLRVDGGMVASDWTMHRLADILDAPVDRPAILETTALGAAYLAGMHVGVYPPIEEFAKSWSLDKRFSPVMPTGERARKLAGWRDAVARTLTDGKSAS